MNYQVIKHKKQIQITPLYETNPITNRYKHINK
jgi:hypothetical protein